MSGISLLIVEDIKKTAEDIQAWAIDAGFDKANVAIAAYPDEAKQKWNNVGGYDAIVLDLHMEGIQMAGFQLLKELRSSRSRPRRVFIYSGHLNDLLLPCEAVQTDVVSFHMKSKDEDELKEQLEAFVTANSTSARAKVHYDTPGWKELKTLLPILAKKSELHVLLLGPSGVGKTTFAKMLAEESGCPIERFFEINCASIPEHLAESELFGHSKGSFTGATTERVGYLLRASGFSNLSGEGAILDRRTGAYKSKDRKWGIVFLDEVAALPPHQQAKLLTVLDGSPMRPISHNGPGFLPNFRVIAASNELEKLQDTNHFRKDLLLRLQGWIVQVPELSSEMVEQLLENDGVFFRNDEGGRDKVKIELGADAKALLLSSDFLSRIEGGIREVKNIIARATLYASLDGAKTVSKTMLEKAIKQNIQNIVGNSTSKKLKADGGASGEQVATEKITAWLRRNGISTEVLNYKNLVKLIPAEKCDEFLKFASDEFTGKEHESGFYAVMTKGLKSKEYKRNTIRAAFSNKKKKAV
jgi:DNA-binding NtrC family response regulator